MNREIDHELADGSLQRPFDRALQGTVAMASIDPSKEAGRPGFDPLLTPEQVAKRLNCSADWVHDHSGRKQPRLPVIRLGGGPGRAGLLRYRASQIEKFIEEMERLSSRGSGRI